LVLKLPLALIQTVSLKEEDSRHTMHPPPPYTQLVEGLTTQEVSSNPTETGLFFKVIS